MIEKRNRVLRLSRMCGTVIPWWIKKRLLDYQDEPASLQAFGLDVVTQLCKKVETLGASGFCFYTLNQAPPTLNILKKLLG